MPKTIIQQITFMCPIGLGNPSASCRFHRPFDNLPADKLCPTCKLVLVKSTNPLDKITVTVIGEEDIETEILEIKDKKIKGKSDKNDPDVSSVAKENAHRSKRRQDIQGAILKARELEDK